MLFNSMKKGLFYILFSKHHTAHCGSSCFFPRCIIRFNVTTVLLTSFAEIDIHLGASASDDSGVGTNSGVRGRTSQKIPAEILEELVVKKKIPPPPPQHTHIHMHARTHL